MEITESVHERCLVRARRDAGRRYARAIRAGRVREANWHRRQVRAHSLALTAERRRLAHQAFADAC